MISVSLPRSPPRQHPPSYSECSGRFPYDFGLPPPRLETQPGDTLRNAGKRRRNATQRHRHHSVTTATRHFHTTQRRHTPTRAATATPTRNANDTPTNRHTQNQPKPKFPQGTPLTPTRRSMTRLRSFGNLLGSSRVLRKLGVLFFPRRTSTLTRLTLT